MRYRLMATYRGVPYEAGVGPTDKDVVLFAACPPPEELGFEPWPGHWRKAVSRAEVDALWESRPSGAFRGEPCLVLDDLGEHLHIGYLGHDPGRAERLGYAQMEPGVFEVLAAREDVTGIIEDRVDHPFLPRHEPAADSGPALPFRDPEPGFGALPFQDPAPGSGAAPWRDPDPGFAALPWRDPDPGVAAPSLRDPEPGYGADARHTEPFQRIDARHAEPWAGAWPGADAGDAEAGASTWPGASGRHREPEAGPPAGPGAGFAAGPEAGPPAGPEAALAAAPEAGPPAGPDTGVHLGPDTGLAAAPDTGLAAAPDTGLAAGPDTRVAAEPDTGLGAGPAPGRRHRRTAGRPPRAQLRQMFAELAGLAALPADSYAVDEAVDGAICLVSTDTGFEVFSAADGVKREARLFHDEEAAYFYLFGLLAAEAVRDGRLVPPPR